MARPKKTAEMEVVFANLKSATFAELQNVIEYCNKELAKKKAAELEEKKAQLEALKAEIAELEK